MAVAARALLSGLPKTDNARFLNPREIGVPRRLWENSCLGVATRDAKGMPQSEPHPPPTTAARSTRLVSSRTHAPGPAALLWRTSSSSSWRSWRSGRRRRHAGTGANRSECRAARTPGHGLGLQCRSGVPTGLRGQGLRTPMPRRGGGARAMTCLHEAGGVRRLRGDRHRRPLPAGLHERGVQLLPDHRGCGHIHRSLRALPLIQLSAPDSRSLATTPSSTPHSTNPEMVSAPGGEGGFETADGVLEKRGAGAGCTAPSTSM